MTFKVIWFCIYCLQLVSMDLVKPPSLQKLPVLDAVSRTSNSFYIWCVCICLVPWVNEGDTSTVHAVLVYALQTSCRALKCI